MKGIYQLVLLFIALMFNSCLNGWERDVVGYYEIQRSALPDSLQSPTYDFPALTLNKDKTFKLAFKNYTKTGEWRAYDGDDWIIVEFKMEGSEIQGMAGVNHISILNPYQFNCPFVKNRMMPYERISKK